MIVIDTDSNVSSSLSLLKAKGVGVVGRYYSSSAWKRLTHAEASLIDAAGVRMFTVFEDDGDPTLTADMGLHHAQITLTQANAVGQPEGSAIYFALEHLPNGYTSSDVGRVKDYVSGLRAGLNGRYKLGVYSDGVVCSALLDAGMCDYAWLSASRGFEGSKAFYASKRWALAQDPHIDQNWDGLRIDLNEAAADFGAFRLSAAGAPSPGARATSMGISTTSVPSVSPADAVLSDGSWVTFDSAPFSGDIPPGNKVLVSIPSDFNPAEPFVITLFLHGHNIDPPCTQLEQIHKIPFQVREAAANAVLLAPRFGPRSEPGKFAQAGALAAFIAEASSKVADILSGSGKTPHEVEQARQYLAAAAPIVIASFSGGCHTLGYLLDNDTEVASRLCGVLLLDSLYDQRPEDSLIAWLKRAFRRSWLVSLYLTTPERNEHVIMSLNAAGIPLSRSNDWSIKVRALAPGTIAFSPATSSHCDIPTVGPPLLPVKAVLDRLDVRYLKTSRSPNA